MRSVERSLEHLAATGHAVMLAAPIHQKLSLGCGLFQNDEIAKPWPDEDRETRRVLEGWARARTSLDFASRAGASAERTAELTALSDAAWTALVRRLRMLGVTEPLEQPPAEEANA